MRNSKKNEKQWILFGATGRIGRAIYAENPGHYVTFGRSSDSDFKITYSQSVQLYKSIQAVLDVESCVGIVYLAGASEVEYCFRMKDESRLVNVDFPVGLWSICNRLKKKFFYASSEYVYSGAAPFEEGASCAPTTTYGIQKYEAESRMLDVSESGLLIFRFGKGINTKNRAENFFSEVFNNLAYGKTVSVAVDQIFNPFDYHELACLFPQIINKNKSGVFNYGASSSVSRYDFVLSFAEILRLSQEIKKVNLNQLNYFSEVRPCDLSMSTTKLGNKFELKLKDWMEIVSDSTYLFMEKNQANY